MDSLRMIHDLLCCLNSIVTPSVVTVISTSAAIRKNSFISTSHNTIILAEINNLTMITELTNTNQICFESFSISHIIQTWSIMFLNISFCKDSSFCTITKGNISRWTLFQFSQFPAICLEHPLSKYHASIEDWTVVKAILHFFEFLTLLTL